MRVRLLFFATLKDIAGSRELQLEVPAGTTVGDLWSQLERTYPRMQGYRTIVLAALNEEYVDRSARIEDGDELALFPPVSGGAA
jgi:molybdopterin converting factor subunit 1